MSLKIRSSHDSVIADGVDLKRTARSLLRELSAPGALPIKTLPEAMGLISRAFGYPSLHACMQAAKTAGEGVAGAEIGLTPLASHAEYKLVVGRSIENGSEISLTDPQVRTNILVTSTESSRRTRYLESLAAQQIASGSGLMWMDSTAGGSIYDSLMAMAVSAGRERDVYLMDIRGTGDSGLSRQHCSMNPFGSGSYEFLCDVLKGLPVAGDLGESDFHEAASIWKLREDAFVDAIMKPLVYLRDNQGLKLNPETVAAYFEISKAEELAWCERVDSPHFGVKNQLLEGGVLDDLQNCLICLPGYDKRKYLNQSESVKEHHGYITMRVCRVLNHLVLAQSELMTPGAKNLDLVDMMLTNKILIVLLPQQDNSTAGFPTGIIDSIMNASIRIDTPKARYIRYQTIIKARPVNAPFLCFVNDCDKHLARHLESLIVQARSMGLSIAYGENSTLEYEDKKENSLAWVNARTCIHLDDHGGAVMTSLGLPDVSMNIRPRIFPS